MMLHLHLVHSTDLVDVEPLTHEVRSIRCSANMEQALILCDVTTSAGERPYNQMVSFQKSSEIRLSFSMKGKGDITYFEITGVPTLAICWEI